MFVFLKGCATLVFPHVFVADLIHRGVLMLMHVWNIILYCCSDVALVHLCFSLVLACGGMAMNSVEDLDPSCLGEAGLVYEHVLVSDDNNNKTISIVPWLPVTVFKSPDTKQIKKHCKNAKGKDIYIY